jgi:predicted SnoaL-like aldol condensation-catalyzing enzyme
MLLAGCRANALVPALFALVNALFQHNPLVPDGAAELAKFFDKKAKDRANLRIVIHRIVAIDDYVWAHVQFINLFNDDPQGQGIGGVDIFKMDPEA